MNKQCFKCKETKLISEFYAHKAMADGHLGKCKTCAKRDVFERVERLKSNPAWVKRERERDRIKQAEYRAKGLAWPASDESRSAWQNRNPEKVKAQQQANNAVKKGLIKKKDKCEICGAGGRIEKHHPDYSKPLEVQFLCCVCHGKTKRKDKEDFDIIP